MCLFFSFSSGSQALLHAHMRSVGLHRGPQGSQIRQPSTVTHASSANPALCRVSRILNVNLTHKRNINVYHTQEVIQNFMIYKYTNKYSMI